MNKEIFMSFMKFGTLGLPKEILTELNGKYFTAADSLIQSTKPEDIQKNIAVLSELEKYLRKISEEHDVDFPDVFFFLSGYYNSDIVCENLKEDDRVPDAFIKSLESKHTENSIIKISQPYNYEQIKYITRQIFNNQKERHPLIFPIPPHEKISGKVVGEIEQRKIKIPLAWSNEIQVKDVKNYAAYVFGETLPKRPKIVDEVNGEFFLYRFLSKSGKEYALASIDKLNLDDYTLDGISIEVEDVKILGDAYRLLNKFTLFFVHTAENHVCQLKNHQQLFQKADAVKITGIKLYDYLCSYKKDGIIQILEHPKWFLRLVSAFLFHKKKGDTAEYPMHLLWISERGAGKTSFMEGVQQKSGETQGIIAGSNSTIKYLIPSFKETRRPEMGALAKASRLCVIDEFFRVIRINHLDHDDECGKMNDLLEHKDRQAGSGHGMIRTSMTARVIAGTNPIAGTKDIINLLERFDDSFLSRFLIYYQTDEHLKLVQQMKKTAQKRYTKDWIDVNDFLSIQDYLQGFDAKYDRQRLIDIFDRFLLFFNEQVKGLYEARYLHHLECLTDGIVKTRCLITRDAAFTATEEDYQEVEQIWSTVLKGWFKQSIDELVCDLNVPIETRLKFLPEDAMFILHKLASIGYKARITELKDKCRIEMSAPKIAFQMSLLHRGGFIKDNNGEAIHYAWEVEERK